MWIPTWVLAIAAVVAATWFMNGPFIWMLQRFHVWINRRERRRLYEAPLQSLSESDLKHRELLLLMGEAFWRQQDEKEAAELPNKR